MKVVWDIHKDVAIPISNVKAFEIGSIDEWSEQSKARWDGGRYFVKASYTICTGSHAIIFSANTKADCIEFIEKI